MLTTTKVARLAGCSRYTVERAIRDKALKAEKAGQVWAIDDDEGQRWAAQYTPYAGLKKRRPGKQAAPQGTGTGQDTAGKPRPAEEASAARSSAGEPDAAPDADPK